MKKGLNMVMAGVMSLTFSMNIASAQVSGRTDVVPNIIIQTQGDDSRFIQMEYVKDQSGKIQGLNVYECSKASAYVSDSRELTSSCNLKQQFSSQELVTITRKTAQHNMHGTGALVSMGLLGVGLVLVAVAVVASPLLAGFAAVAAEAKAVYTIGAAAGLYILNIFGMSRGKTQEAYNLQSLQDRAQYGKLDEVIVISVKDTQNGFLKNLETLKGALK